MAYRIYTTAAPKRVYRSKRYVWFPVIAYSDDGGPWRMEIVMRGHRRGFKYRDDAQAAAEKIVMATRNVA